MDSQEEVWNKVARHYFNNGTGVGSNTMNILRHLYGEKSKQPIYNVHNELLSSGWIERGVKPFSSNVFQITKFGISMYSKYGSYTAWKDYELKVHALTTSKLEHEEKLARWQVKTFWWLFAFAIIGGGYSMFDLVRNISIGEYHEEKDNSTNTKSIYDEIVLPSNNDTTTISCPI